MRISRPRQSDRGIDRRASGSPVPRDRSARAGLGHGADRDQPRRQAPLLCVAVRSGCATDAVYPITPSSDSMQLRSRARSTTRVCRRARHSGERGAVSVPGLALRLRTTTGAGSICAHDDRHRGSRDRDARRSGRWRSEADHARVSLSPRQLVPAYFHGRIAGSSPWLCGNVEGARRRSIRPSMAASPTSASSSAQECDKRGWRLLGFRRSCCAIAVAEVDRGV